MRRVEIRRLLQVTSWVVLVAAPFLIASILLDQRIGASLWDLSPLWADEVHYWHQTRTFAEVGFNNGYYTVLEAPAPASFARYFSWGTTIPAFYGTIARVFGWYLTSMPIVNLILLTLALICVVVILRPTYLQALFLTIGIGLLPTFLSSYFSTGIPLLQIASALVMGIGFARLLRDDTPNLRQYGWLALILIFASLIRVTWAMLFIPYITLLLRQRKLPALLGGIMAGTMLMLGFVVWYQWTAAPFPNAFNAIFGLMQTDFGAGLQALADNIMLNWGRLFAGDPVELWGRWKIVLIIIAVIVVGIGLAWRSPKEQRSLRLRAWGWQMAFHSYNLLGLLVMVLVLYDVAEWRDLRIFAPRILLSLVVFIALNQRFLACVVIVPMLILLPDSLRIHDIWGDFHVNPDRPAQYTFWQEELSDVLIYDPDAPNGWCNTVYHSLYYLFNQVPMLMAIDSGMGLSYPADALQMPPYKSRYLLLDDEYYAQIASELRAQYLRDIPNGALYLNLDSACAIP